MPDYWVFWDEIVGRIRIHRAGCGACKYGTGLYKVKSTEWPHVNSCSNLNMTAVSARQSRAAVSTTLCTSSIA